MEWLNYHHLYYFWIVAREGTIAAAGQELGLAPSTISEQIHQLERSLNQKIFKRSGRRLVLTDVGQVVFRFADEIFTLGRELSDFVQGRPTGRPMRLNVGIADVVPKLVTRKLLEPALRIPEKIHLICREDRPERLLADLALHQLDVVITDSPVGPDARVRAFNHLLGECGVVFFGAPALAQRLRPDFPRSLHGAPFLLPTSESVLRRMLDQWFDTREMRPDVVAEFEDSALLKVFGQGGMGVFPGPEVVAEEVCRQYGVEVIGQADGLRERFYAVSVERKLKHPAVVAISEAARDATFNVMR
jgi:LysR family transcriptional activator of nhaA